MMRLIARRNGGHAPDAGAYAILYAVLVVVLFGMAAIVVDFAHVRSDRRLGRSATDAAAIGGAAFLNPQVSSSSPYAACKRAWGYISATVTNTPTPANACGKFDPNYKTAASLSTCRNATTQPVEIDDDRVVGNRTYRVAWPIPTSGGTGFLNPELAPGSVTQSYAPGLDGPTTGHDWGCDRLGVAMFETASLPLGSAIGVSGTSTQVHSVARFDAMGGADQQVAALNVLNQTDCNTLVKGGTGAVIVGPTLLKGSIVGPGIIAVESDASRSSGSDNCNGASDAAININGTGADICANGTGLTSCDGNGIIESHALDGNNSSHAYNAGSGIISPTPIAEGGTHGYAPVTSHYGCNITRLPCTPPATNYIANLESAYGGSGTPTLYVSSQNPYIEPFGSLFTNPVAGATPGTFTARTDLCTVTGVLIVPAGNWYADCGTGGITVRGTLIIQGGNLVSTGGINVTGTGPSPGCFVMNTAVTSCPTTTDGAGNTVWATSGSGASITTATPPTHDATIFLRSGSITYDGNLAIPQTFVYAMGAGGGSLGGSASLSPLWTAPGAGASDGDGNTELEKACGATATTMADQDCMDSRFSRTAYWSDYAAPQTPTSSSNTFQGQGNLGWVGVFFTPLAYDRLTGGATGASAAAQFWADKLIISGGGTMTLSPDARFSFLSPTSRIRLIR
jgi:hypothetical protein